MEDSKKSQNSKLSLYAWIFAAAVGGALVSEVSGALRNDDAKTLEQSQPQVQPD